jgi:hypothetical protein
MRSPDELRESLRRLYWYKRVLNRATRRYANVLKAITRLEYRLKLANARWVLGR